MRLLVGATTLLALGGATGGPLQAGQGEALTLCVVVDVTASTMSTIQLPGTGFDREEADERLATTMGGLAGLLEPADRLRVGRIAATVAFSPAFVTRDRAAAASGVLSVSDTERFGPSPIWDAVYEALDLLAEERGRRAVLVWTDGRASGNRVGRHDVARRAAELGIPVSIVSGPTETVIRLTETTGVRIRPAVYLEWLSDVSGGQFKLLTLEPAHPFGNPLPAFGEILDGLRGSVRR